MKMNPTDLADVSGYTYTYLMNGQAPLKNWTGLFRPGEKIRLRFINGSAMTYFDIRIPGLKMTVVAADGQYVNPVTVDEFRIAVAETYDVIVEPQVRPIPSSHNPWTGPVTLEDTHHERRVMLPFPPRSPSSVDHGRYGYGGNGT